MSPEYQVCWQTSIHFWLPCCSQAKDAHSQAWPRADPLNAPLRWIKLNFLRLHVRAWNLREASTTKRETQVPATHGASWVHIPDPPSSYVISEKSSNLVLPRFPHL